MVNRFLIFCLFHDKIQSSRVLPENEEMFPSFFEEVHVAVKAIGAPVNKATQISLLGKSQDDPAMISSLVVSL